MQAMTGACVVLGVCLPLILHPPAFQKMIFVLTNITGFIHPCPSFWQVYKDFVGRYRIEHLLQPYLSSVYHFQILLAMFCAIFVFLKPTREMFLGAFSISALTLYLFGFHVHEKHIQYMFMSFLLYALAYRHFMTYAFVLSVWALLPIACTFSNDTFFWKYAGCMLIYAVLYEKLVLFASKE